MMLVACSGGQSSPASRTATPAPSIATTAFAPNLAIDLRSFTRNVSGLYFLDVQRGNGPVAADRRKAVIRYVVYLPDATLADVQQQPIEVDIGPGMIRGLREGLIGMRTGGQRRLIVPASLGYGRARYRDIPPNSILVFEVELLGVR